jgi:SAM-dependent methyltransferase
MPRQSYGLDYVGGRKHGGARFYSFAHQLATIAAFEPSTVLEIGAGSGVATASLRQLGVQVTTLDFDPGLQPDVVGDVRALPVEDGAFDVVSCCQVLEHIPFDDVGTAAAELTRVARCACIISVPDVTRHISFSLQLPRLGRRVFSAHIGGLRPRTLPESRRRDHGHEWEIGFAGFPLRRVRRQLTPPGATLARTWRVPELPWHRFFLLTK